MLMFRRYNVHHNHCSTLACGPADNSLLSLNTKNVLLVFGPNPKYLTLDLITALEETSEDQQMLLQVILKGTWTPSFTQSRPIVVEMNMNPMVVLWVLSLLQLEAHFWLLKIYISRNSCTRENVTRSLKSVGFILWGPWVSFMVIVETKVVIRPTDQPSEEPCIAK